jgi:hypothetical protein
MKNEKTNSISNFSSATRLIETYFARSIIKRAESNGLKQHSSFVSPE